MKLIVVVALLVGLVHANGVVDPEQLDAAFEQFKVSFGRTYATKHEEQQRKLVFQSNLETIVAHNTKADVGLHTYRLGVNQFADRTNLEFRQMFNGFKMPKVQTSREIFQPGPEVSLNSSVDWTTKGVVTPVKNQGPCGASWAFSAVVSIEGQHALKTGQLVSLSERNLADCSGPEGNSGCGGSGGTVDDAFKYVINNHGIDTEASYPNVGSDGTCKFKRSGVGATIVSYTDLPSGNEQALQQAVGTIGPVSVTIDAGNPSFQLYCSGVYNEANCSKTALDHAVAVVGYGTLNAQDYWKVKNSWGLGWGEHGYILMARNKDNQCGIATMASYTTA